MDRSKAVAADADFLLKHFDVFLFDMDGVLWLGPRALPGAADALMRLRARGKALFFVTNNASRSRKDIADKFSRLGLSRPPDIEVRTSAAAAAHFVADYFRSSFPASDGVAPLAYVIGERGLVEELRLAGVDAFGPEEHRSKSFDPQSGDAPPVPDARVRAVVVGFDGSLSYYKLAYATRCAKENKGCLFIAANADAIMPSHGGVLLPAAGCIVSALQTAVGRAPVICGKPQTLLWEQLHSEIGGDKMDTNRVLMIGDNLETDIAFGHNCHMHTLLVMSGMTKAEDLSKARPEVRPDFVADSIGKLFAQV